MQERDETILFSAVGILLAAITLASLGNLAFPDARAAVKDQPTRFVRSAACTATAAAPAAQPRG
jgi:hypothetical protein